MHKASGALKTKYQQVQDLSHTTEKLKENMRPHNQFNVLSVTGNNRSHIFFILYRYTPQYMLNYYSV